MHINAVVLAADGRCSPQDAFACSMLEEIIRYHILCEHELCESEATVNDPEGFSSHLNIEQLNKVHCSYSLLLRQLTDLVASRPGTTPRTSPLTSMSKVLNKMCIHVLWTLNVDLLLKLHSYLLLRECTLV